MERPAARISARREICKAHLRSPSSTRRMTRARRALASHLILPVQIRQARPTDVEVLVPLIASYWRYDGIDGVDEGRLTRQIEEFLAQPAFGQAWLADVDGVAGGYLICTFVYSFEHGGLMAEIDEVFVEQGLRGQGIGQALVAEALHDLSARGCHALQMQVADDNGAAKDFYRRLDFTEKAGYRLWIKAL